MTIVRTALVVALTVFTLGCGGILQSDEDQVKDTWNSYVKAIVEGDGKTACPLITNQARQSFEASAGTTCQSAIAAAGPQIPTARRTALLNSTLTSVSVNGDTATALVNWESGNQSGTAATKFRHEDGKWRIATLNSISG